MSESTTEFETPMQLTKNNWEEVCGFPIDFPLELLTRGEATERDVQIYNLVMALMGYDGKKRQENMIAHLKESYAGFQKWADEQKKAATNPPDYALAQ